MLSIAHTPGVAGERLARLNRWPAREVQLRFEMGTVYTSNLAIMNLARSQSKVASRQWQQPSAATRTKPLNIYGAASADYAAKT